MTENRFENLPEYAFPRLRALVNHLPRGGEAELNLALGEPQHPFPDFIGEVLAANQHLLNKYPPNDGTPEFRAAIAGWLNRRYGLDPAHIDVDQMIVPLSGTREGLFSIGLTVIPQSTDVRPKVLMPNPFYPPYAGCAAAAGALPIFVDGTEENGYLPDYAALSPDILSATALAFICSPANPQGSIASLDYLKALLRLARKHEFVLVADECYSEVYDFEKPPGALEAAEALQREDGNTGHPFRNLLVFNSLSKRSNLAGLRSGFVTGDPEIIQAYKQLRSYGGAPSSLPVYAAAAAAWSDEAHVERSRQLYVEKFDTAESILSNRFDFRRPPGGFFLWLNVGDGEGAAKTLWREAGVRVLPGAYVAAADAEGFNASAPYIRVALVHDNETVDTALRQIAAVL